MTYFAGVINKSLVSSGNSYTSTIAAAGNFTGTAETNEFDGVQVSGVCDQSGELYLEFYYNGAWYSIFPPGAFYVIANIPFFHTAKKGNRQFRVRLENTSASTMNVTLNTVYGPHTQGNLPLNMSVGQDADSIVVRQVDYFNSVARGEFTGVSDFDKYGYNDAVSTTLAPVALQSVYQTPTTNTTLELYCANAADTAAGAGAQEVEIFGVYFNGSQLERVSTTVATNGIGVTAIAQQFARVYRTRVTKSGTYATSAAPSQVGNIDVRVAGGGATWARVGIITTGFGAASTEVAAYTTAYDEEIQINGFTYNVEGSKQVNLYFFKREGVNDITTPFSPMIMLRRFPLLAGSNHIPFKTPFTFDPNTDFGFMARTASGNSAISVEMRGIQRILI